MKLLSRLSATIIAAAVVVSVATESVPAYAQATVGPAGGVGSNTTPSNGQGTPAGGTGVVGSTRVGPSGVTPIAPVATTPDAAPAPVARRARRHRRHHAVRHTRRATQIGTQSQTNPAPAQ